MAESRPDGGTATAELAVALPAVVLAMGATVAVGQLAMAQVAGVDAARAGARAAARGEADARVRQASAEVAGPGAAPVRVTVTRGELVQVRVARRVQLLLPGLPWVEVVSQAVAQVEPSATAQQPPPTGGRALGRQSGSATVLVLAALALVAVLATTLAGLGAAVVARHRAQAAADLSALAAADALLGRSPRLPCPAAARVAAAQGARVVSCVLSGATVSVIATVSPAGAAAGLGEAVGRARAGPAGVRPVGGGNQ